MSGFFMANAELGYSTQVEDDKPHEECGFVGVSVPYDSAPLIVRNALIALQHRGPDSAGITVLNGKMNTRGGLGLIPGVLTQQVMEQTGGSRVASAHVRYSTKGGITDQNIQPIQRSSRKSALSLAHNGSLTNPDSLRERLDEELSDDASDTVVLTAYLLQQRQYYSSWEETFQQELPNAQGAYSAVAITEDGNLHGFRDVYGVRPYAIGTLSKGGIILASESVAIDAVGGKFARHLQRGEILTITPDGDQRSVFYGEPSRGRFCTFENFYFMRPESFNNDIRVLDGREESGRILADNMLAKGIQIDGVVPIKESGSPAGSGFSERSGIPIIHAVGTSHYVGRSFTLSDQMKREEAVSSKHTIIPDHIRGKSLATIDDSTLRGTTSRIINTGLLRGGASKIHQGAASPPGLDKCTLGVDLRDKKELPAAEVADRPLAEIEVFMAKRINSTTMTYLTLDQTSQAFGRETRNMCTACLGGEHPVHGPQEEFPQKERPIVGKPKLAVFISGNGTNLQKIIDGTQNGSIDADIISVVSNNPDAFGLTRAEEADIPTAVVSSKKRLSDPIKRTEYETELLEAVINNPPDVLVLAGFMTVLSDEFLQAMQELEIPVLNLHPGLLTVKNGERVATSQGLMPVLRGTNAIEEAYSQGIPTSGVTVHQLLPGNTFDTGPIVLKQEVHRRDDDTREDWERRIHETEYQILTMGINRVLHVMKHNIDVSKGDFPW